jgi:hypothetical protein
MHLNKDRDIQYITAEIFLQWFDFSDYKVISKFLCFILLLQPLYFFVLNNATLMV